MYYVKEQMLTTMQGYRNRLKPPHHGILVSLPSPSFVWNLWESPKYDEMSFSITKIWSILNLRIRIGMFCKQLNRLVIFPFDAGGTFAQPLRPCLSVY